MGNTNRLQVIGSSIIIGAVIVGYLWFKDLPLETKQFASWLLLFFTAVVGAIAWQHGLRRHRLVDDIPTSAITSASQGYVELVGKACPLPDDGVRLDPRGLECLWYRYYMIEGESFGWRTQLLAALFPTKMSAAVEETGTSFGICHDGTTMHIFPHGAEVICKRTTSWNYGGDYYALEYILPEDLLYILGDLSTVTPNFNRLKAYDNLTADLSTDSVMVRQFDQNKNGRIELDEWEKIHQQALRIVSQEEKAALLSPAIHHIFKPSDDLPYIISSVPPHELAGHYRWWMVLGAVLFFVGGSAAIWLASVLWA